MANPSDSLESLNIKVGPGNSVESIFSDKKQQPKNRFQPIWHIMMDQKNTRSPRSMSQKCID